MLSAYGISGDCIDGDGPEFAGDSVVLLLEVDAVPLIRASLDAVPQFSATVDTSLTAEAD